MGRAYRYPPKVAFYILFSTNIITEYFKHAAHSPFFSSKCRLFHNATFLVPVLLIFYIQDVLNFKCKTPVPNVNTMYILFSQEIALGSFISAL
jgi:hypothetical protein